MDRERRGDQKLKWTQVSRDGIDERGLVDKEKEFEEGKQPGPQNQLLNFHFSVSIKSEKRFPEPFISSFTCTFHSLMEEGLLQRLERYFFFTQSPLRVFQSSTLSRSNSDFCRNSCPNFIECHF